MKTINRQIAIIKPKQPYVDWINSLQGMSDDPSSIESLNSDCTGFLLPHFDDEAESLKFIKKNYRTIFNIELYSWSTDKSVWPKKRNYTLFSQWFKVEYHSELYDFNNGKITKNDC